MSELRHVGRDTPRPDAAVKATGRALYVHDLVRPGMLHGKIKFSEHAHARIVDIDTSRAERVPGVRAVITAANTPELRIGFLRDVVDTIYESQIRLFFAAAMDYAVANPASTGSDFVAWFQANQGHTIFYSGTFLPEILAVLSDRFGVSATWPAVRDKLIEWSDADDVGEVF